MYDEDDRRKIAFREQQRILSALARKGWTQAALARRIGVRAQSVRAWMSNRSLARSTTLAKLKVLSRERAPVSRKVVGRTKNKDLKRRELLLRTYGLRSSAKRAAILQDWIARTACSRRDFAEFLGVSLSTVESYLNPRWPGRISLPVLERIANILDGSHDLNRTDRFDVAVQRLFGPHNRTGFPRSTASRVVGKLAPFLEMSARNVFRLLPPYPPSWVPSENAVRAFETAVQRLSRIYGSPKSLIDSLLASGSAGTDSPG